MKTMQVPENHGDEWGLVWYLPWGIYTSISTWINSQDSAAAGEAWSLLKNDIPSWNISQIKNHEDYHKDSPNQHRTNIEVRTRK